MKRLLVGMAVLGVAACSTKKPGDTTTPGDATTLEAPAARGPSDDLKALLASVPPDAAALLFIDAQVGEAATALMPPERAKAMRTELEAYMLRELGVNILEARAFVAFGGVSAAGPSAGLLLRPVSGTLKTDRLEGAGAIPLQLHLLEDTLLIGLPGTVERVSYARTSGKSFVNAEPWVEPWLTKSVAMVAAAVDFAKLRNVPGVPTDFERVTLSLGGGRAMLDIRGDQAVLEELRGNFMEGLDEGLASVEQAREEATTAGAPPLQGIATIVAYHMAMGGKESVPPVENGAFEIDVPLGEASPVAVVAIVGMLSAVAIPAFMKYIAKSKTTEAKSNLQAMRAGARAYAVENGRFPPSAPLSPAGGPCGADKCQPDPGVWQHPTWQALNFSVDGPHYYAYEFVSDGQTFTARALGDLDGDGQHSTFEVYGIMEDGIPAGEATVAAENELE